MEGFDIAADFPERMSHVYSAIAQELERLGITALYTTETRELFARSIEVPINGLSAATQNIILLRHVEHRAAMLRILAILKVRDADYDPRIRELQNYRRWHPSVRYLRRRGGCRVGRRTVDRHTRQDVRGLAVTMAPYSILIVDDEFGLAEMLRDMLRESGFDVSLAINGRLALEILAEEQVDLVLTDMMMPVMDGIELATAIRGNRRLRATQIIMMTSLPTVPHQSGTLFDAVLRKPFTPDLLVETISRLLADSEKATERSLHAEHPDESSSC